MFLTVVYFVTVSLAVCILLYWVVFVFYFAGLLYVTVLALFVWLI